ncbi:endo-1,3(4)-beta-glucanase [Coprinopsis sp. MPI-PUGE-AT-0042]|nr:endo-1,3(4)-beta-glucanase [Coprinopsis sp. MPI-PUGE-AT-0042]
MSFVALFTTALLLAAPLEGLAGAHDDFPLRSARRHSNAARALQRRNDTTLSASPYKIQDFYRGESFLDEWEFHSEPDPTHGLVNYQAREDAIKKKLAFVQEDGTTVLAVDDFSDVPVGGKRDSVRITTKKKYNGGLFIADFFKMPHGCSVWPAYWSVGPDWPNGGEIDILEGVHDMPTNQYTLHTSEGCTLSHEGIEVSARRVYDQCAVSGADNRGCSFIDTDVRSYGKPFNMISGGVFAHLWNSDGIKVWHFARGEIPEDIEAQQPNPDTWGSPVAFWSPATCDMSKHFYEHSLVIDTTICGDWAGPSYAGAGCAGTCEQAVANTTIFKWAKWKINYIATYQTV